MVAAILIVVVLLFFGWLLFMPLVIDVDTSVHSYQVYQYGTIRFWLSPGLQPHMSIFGFSIPWKRSKVAVQAKPKPKSKRQFPFRNIPELLKGIYHSITVRWFRLDLDTDDVVLNAQMIPAFTFLSSGAVQLTTNFEGRVYASLRAELKLYRIGWAFLLFYIKK
jgi:hypothetical protein